MKQFLLFIILCFSLTVFSQSYEITYENSTYDTLVDYTSISLEEGNTNYWERVFDFGFDFPFYENTLQQIIIHKSGYAKFPGNEDSGYNINLFAAEWDVFEFDESVGYLDSDVRYAFVEENRVNALVIEWHNVYFEPEFDYYDTVSHSINYQAWFFENGLIEVRIGDIDVEDCVFYFPGIGFSDDMSEPEEGSIYGPWLGIVNDDYDYSDMAFFTGHHINPTFYFDNSVSNPYNGVMTSIPDEGFVVRFLPTFVSVEEEWSEGGDLFEITQIENGVVIVDQKNSFVSCDVLDIQGRLLFTSFSKEINLSNLKPQMLILEVKGKEKSEVRKIVF